ncbi:uncharacterized protein LOC130495007 [Raphanus sativus]|uniref:Uncharacterized protein LOC130495007 n=1 Tax=Raphanus sativus TaxID=3726 RepID=A0A9W3BRM2_RAPSA|nr:uncharacterized protein LOC130495007 [Raphanus sativus]
MQSRWVLPGRASAVQPSSSTSGDAPPRPPDPPDPNSPLSPLLFPPLAASPPPSRSELRRSHLTSSPVDTVMASALGSPPASVISTTTTQFGSFAEIESTLTVPLATGNPNSLPIISTSSSLNTLNHSSPTPTDQNSRFKTIPPNQNSPLLSNPAANNPNPPLPINPQSPIPVSAPTIPQPPLVQTHQFPPSSTQPLQNHPSTLAETLRLRGDKSLQREAPVMFSDTGRPRVLIPDAVFEKGAELHKDFIVCYFNGRPPPFKHIQSVLSHMWAKGRRLEMHNNPLQRSVLVRIPSEFLRQKILDKNIWYVGDSMFHTAQWTSIHSSATPPLSSIKIWAHLTGVPLDLRYNKGLGLVAGLIGDPKETDDFTLNLVSLTLSHVKVEVDLTKPLPNVVEFERQSGEVVEVQVDYPWLPPKCSHCQELGHVIRNCLLYTPPKDTPPMEKVPVEKQKQKTSENPKKHSAKSTTGKQYVPKKTIPPKTPEKTLAQSASLPTSPTAFKTPSFTPPSALKHPLPSTESPSDKPHKPSLKRTRSSPTFSPPEPPKISYQSSKPSLSLPFPEVETHIKELSLPRLMSTLCRDWHYLSNHLSDEDGRIVLIWKDPAKVTMISQSRQMVTCEVRLPNCSPIIYSAIYASNLLEERTDLWVELLNLHSTHGLDSRPWMIGGDFNQILHSHEHSSFSHSRHASPMFQFRDCLLQLGVFDLRYYGPVHTWTNKRDVTPVAKKLDRCLINNECLTVFPNATATFLPPAPSDHTPCLTDLAFQLPQAGTPPFRFFNYLTKHPSFLEVQALNDPTPETFAAERDQNLQWQFLRQIEECYFMQKSRITWLREGDFNTTYFHRVCQVRASFNAIRSFLLASGVVITDPLAMSAHAISHFQAVLGPETLQTLWFSPSAWFHSLTSITCTHQQRSSILLMPTVEEITKLMFSLNPNKAPGPDGLTSGFFKASWSLLGVECVTSIQTFFNSGFLPKATNSTILSLVPKFTGASKVSDYRPISCLNTLYKVISRLLVRRLKPILQNLILPNQTAFVEGRLLVENTVLASELVNGYHKNRGSKRITIKVDIAKAFDTLSWDFLFAALESLELPAPFVRLLRACICTPSFMVGYNGTVSGYFKGKRGLRQGDPLSPYLFVIAMNYLSLMLDKEARSGYLSYHHQCHKTRLTHLSFADDLLIFIDGSLESVQRVLQILHEFEKRSGLAVSLQKSSFFASGVSEQELQAIQVSTGMPCGSLPMRYLGVPLCTKKLNLENCQPLLQQIKQRLSSWSAKALSFAGRLLLIKTVIAGVSTFWCSTFILPKACINKINSLCGVFLWNGNIDGHHTARVSWETVTLTKDQGGLGVKDLHKWNLACLLKLVWMLFFRPKSVWVCWFKEVILRGDVSNYWTVKTSTNYSWLVNKMIKVRDQVYPLLHRRLGNGETTRFWFDNWSPLGHLYTLLNASSSRLGIPRSATVASLFTNGHWSLPPARTENQLALQVHLTTVTLSEEADYYEWMIEGKLRNRYNMGEVYTYLKGPQQTVTWAKIVWFSYGIPRHNFLTWLVLLDRCPTKDRLIRWGMNVTPLCLLCNTSHENRNHLFFDCVYSATIWRQTMDRCGFHTSTSWDCIVTQLQALQVNRDSKRLTLIAMQACIYWIWSERNKRLHHQVFRPPEVLFSLIDKQVRNRLQSIRHANPRASSAMSQLWFLRS